LCKKIKGDLIVNKSELIAAVAAKAGLTKKDAEKAVSAFIETVKATVAKKKSSIDWFWYFRTS